MCCAKDDAALKRFKAKMERNGQAWFWGWKMVRARGRAQCARYRYAPGIHRATIPPAGYCRNKPQGIHVFRRHHDPQSALYCNVREVRVKCRVCDIVLMSALGKEWDKDQVVLTRIQILVADWKAAGLPMPKRKKPRTGKVA